MVETMKPKTGRMAVVAPHGVLFRGAAEGKIRQKLVEENLIDAVIGLPEKLFYGTGIPAAILVLRQNKTDKNILFIDAAREFLSGKNQNQLSDENIKKVIDTYSARKSVDKYAYLASPQELAENDFNLNIPRYVDTFEEEDEIDLMAVRDERKKLKAELADLEEKMDGYLKELGYAV
jgi:type I restriction enzyme M protein